MTWIIALLSLAVPFDYDRDGDEGSRNRNGNDCQDAKAECHDNDFSPQFDESPVTIVVCVEDGSCQFR